MVSKFIGDSTRYIISRYGIDDREDLASVDAYADTVYWIDSIDGCTKFESIEEAKKILEIQESMAKALRKDWKFRILEEKRIITDLES